MCAGGSERSVVVKSLPRARFSSTSPSSSAASQALHNELNALCALQRARHIVAMRGVVESRSSISLLLEWAHGPDLLSFTLYEHRRRPSERIRGGLGDAELHRFSLQLAQALRFVHHSGFCHRDVKLDNLVLDASRQALVIVDWDHAAPLPASRVRSLDDSGKDVVGESHGSLTQTVLFTQRCGSSAYLSPERAAGQPYDGVQADLWSFGVWYALICEA